MTRPSIRLRLARIAAAAIILAATARATAAAPGVPETRQLANGLRIVLLEDHAVPLASVSVWVGAGSKFEVEASTGYAHFLEHMIQRGAGSSGPFEYTRLANRWGGGLSVHSNYDRTSITMSGVPQTVGDMIDAAAAMALRADLKDSEIDLELGTLTQEIRTYYDLPASVAFLETMRAAFPEHPYRWPTLGNFKSVGTLRAEPLQAFYRNLYVPNNMAIVVAGDVEPKSVMTRLEAAFGGAARSATLPARPAPPATLPGHSDIEKRLDFRENWTTLAFVGPGYRHPDRAAFEVLAAALADPAAGLGAGARADQAGNLAQVSYYGLEDAGLLYIALNPATPELSYTAAAGAMRALVAFRNSPMTEPALRDLVARLLRDERARATSLQERSERLGEALLFGGPRYYWDRPELLRALTPADIARVAARYLVNENMRLVVLVPRDTAPLPEASKDAFHKALEGLGSAGANLASGLDAALYTGDDAQRVSASSWGDAKAAAAPHEPVRTVLKNGLTLITVEDGRWPLAAASLHLRGGSENDPEGREGATAIALRLLGARTAAALRSAAPAGGRRAALLPEAQAMRDAIELRFAGDTADLPAGLAALARAVDSPLPGGDIEAARQAALAALQRADRDPDAVALDLLHEKVFAGHPYAHRPDGTPAGLRAVTAEDVAAAGARLLRPGGAILAVAGDIDPAAVTREVQRLFGGWKGERGSDQGRRKSAPAAAAPADAAPAATAGALAGSFSRQMDLPQSRVVAGVPGVRAGDADFAGLRALGAGVTLLAYDEIIFRRRAAFSAVATPEAFREGGALSVTILTPPLRAAEALFDVQRLMRRMAVEPLPADDVRDIGRMLAGRAAATAQSALALASELAWREASGAGIASWRADLSGAIPDAAGLQALAERRFHPESMVTIVVGPASP